MDSCIVVLGSVLLGLFLGFALITFDMFKESKLEKVKVETENK